MSLDTAEPILVNALLQIMKDEANEENSAESSRARIAEKMAGAIKDFVKAGQVKVTVATTGTATAQTGTGIGNMI
ncbi:hypothetical protein C1637_18575 [Chryseobacterium lactis]|uniref:Uncharacterized protein n=1 Tax=Chryseobacterium lactis TaxID=1241981 RepID=A0A3G6RQ58_CHRLC|nr:hypothetical protein [Chryseobacterium lactis]AZA84788.1 hypothetical protein EG342_24085 [Chryseobacterium lactis]AZB05177.1 hypothetical protein EG341_14965 [Chryseobacterium lactis]PNW12159.1 hypothetical protein C1637_18575 [Chryseobacterium lactis]